MVQPLWRTVWRFLKKVKIELPYDPAIPLLGNPSGINIYTVLCIKQIINKDLLYSTGNSTQYAMITYMGKKSEKE